MIVLVLVASACTSATPPTTSSPPETAATLATTPPIPTTTPTTEVVTTTTTAFPVQLATNRSITEEELLFMHPDSEMLGGEYRGLVADDPFIEPNEELIRSSLQDPEDEAQDIDLFARTDGSRAIFEPRWFSVGSGRLLGLEFWVGLFETDAGASGYLDDFVQDAGKGVGGGVPSDLIVQEAEDFAVEELGQESVGLVLAERQAGEADLARFQTLVAFRIGRLLGFVSVLHPDDADRRVRALELAEVFEQRVSAILAGDLVPPEPEPQPQPLLAYEFTYRQVIDKGPTIGIITATGTEVVGSSLDCLVRIDLGRGVINERRYVVEGKSVRVNAFDPEEPGFRSTSLQAYVTAADLLYCPGWPVELVPAGLDLVLAGQPIEEIEFDGAPSVSYSLGYDQAVGTGFIPEDSSIEIDEFTVITDAVSPWTRSLHLEASGRASAFAEAYGREFVLFSGRRVSVSIDFEATRINDPELLDPEV